MNNLSAKTDLVFQGGDEIFTSSLIVAKHFQKRHKNVIQKIENISIDTLLSLKFVLSDYTDSTGRSHKMYLLNRTAFMVLIMNFTGQSANKWKAYFLEAFNTGAEISALIEMLNNMDVTDLPPNRFVYVARESESGRYRVGISKNPVQRIKELNTGNPEKLVLVHAYLATEHGHLSKQLAHESLSKHRLRSEWFDDHTALNVLPSYHIENHDIHT